MKRICIILTLIFFISGQLFAQLEIGGQVKNKSGEPIPGVNCNSVFPVEINICI